MSNEPRNASQCRTSLCRDRCFPPCSIDHPSREEAPHFAIHLRTNKPITFRVPLDIRKSALHHANIAVCRVYLSDTVVHPTPQRLVESGAIEVETVAERIHDCVSFLQRVGCPSGRVAGAEKVSASGCFPWQHWVELMQQSRGLWWERFADLEKG